MPPNYFVMDLQARTRTSLSRFTDPAPSLTSVRKQLVKYARPDGVPLSGTLYLPRDTSRGQGLPLVVWAYPLEYSDPGTAGQVRAAPNRFTFYRGTTPLFFLTQGYAVLMDATMPVVGDPETMNDTFVEQIVAGREGGDRRDRLDGRRRSEAGGGDGAQLRRVHDREPAGPLRLLRRRHRAKRRLQPHPHARSDSRASAGRSGRRPTCT